MPWLVLACMVVTLSASQSASGGTSPARTVDRQRVFASYAALQRRFFSRLTGRYRDSAAGARGSSAAAWSFSQAFAATVSVAGVSQAPSSLRRAVVGREREAGTYWDPHTVPPGYAPTIRQCRSTDAAQYYDDNDWLGLDLVATWRRLHRPQALAQAEQVFTLASSGWDDNENDTCPGGVFWTHWHGLEDRNAVSTANAALLAVRLYEATRSATHLNWAGRMYAWVVGCLTRPDGLIADHIRGDGSIDDHAWAYNQGAMIADGTLLFRATGNRSYLEQAENLARLSLSHFTSFRREPPIFVAIFFRDLGTLTAIDGSTTGRKALQAYADHAWTCDRPNARTALFRFNRPPTILDQSAMAQIYATLAGSRWPG
jgi:hypothetical protein